MAGLCLFSVFCLGQEPAPAQPPASTQNQSAAPGQQTPDQSSNSSNPEKVSPDKANPDTASPDKATTGQDATATDTSSSKSSATSERLLFAMPNFLTVANGGKVPPLTPKQKFALVASRRFRLLPVSLVRGDRPDRPGPKHRASIRAGLGGLWQALCDVVRRRHHRKLHCRRRVSLHTSPGSPLLPVGGWGRPAHRAGYAVSRIFITRSDSGHKQFNFSEVFGSATASAISTFSYHPRSTFVTTPTGIKFIAIRN